MTSPDAKSIAIDAPIRRWRFGIASAIMLVLVWGGVFFNLIEKRDNEVQGIEYVLDEHAALALSSVIDSTDLPWQSIGEDSSLGMNTAAFWFRFELPSRVINDSEGDFILEVDYPMLDELDIWLVDKKTSAGLFNIIEHYRLGDTIAFSERPIPHPLFLIPLKHSNDITHVYARVKTSGTVRYPVSIWKSTEYIADSTKHASIMALFFGFMVAMAISNLFFFITTRSVTFLVYTGYVLGLGITIATLHGFAFQYLWPSNTFVQGRAIAIFASLTLTFAVVFSYQTLDVIRHSVSANRYLQVLAAIFALYAVISCFAPYAIVIKVFMLMLLMAVVSILACGIWLSLRGSEVARYYTLAWAFLLLSGFSATLDNLNLVELPVSSHYILIFGASIETLLLGLILAMRYSQQRDSLSAAQAQALEQEQEATKAKDELIQVQQQSQDELEYKVQERTLELEIALRELSEANRELEKISAMDQLTSLPNRRHFDKRLLAESRRSRREQTPLAIAMVDVDHFKQVNDQYGHVVGDECLKQIAAVLKSGLKRPTDEVCRYGGEEFALIMPNTDLLGATQVIEEMRQAVAETLIQTDHEEMRVTISAGVTSSSISFEGQETALIEFADKLLYDAKRNGRDQVIGRAFSQKQQDKK
ncbi:sensor domain-containing diguanylate cyclase [Alteromonas facilis]|uniref:sensor domain-containing diguanylate cyclase n=1 Tax=Alteromonas facilis TaxID=2048004 RepID=UPI000C294C4C|nr:diguanylate cyclase [Alteromonas facilis]